MFNKLVQHFRPTLVAIMFVAMTTSVACQDQPASEPVENVATEGPSIGPVTGLPLPRFASLKSNKVNARRGPSTSHRIDWVFLRTGIPLEIIAEFGNWRRIKAVDGVGGWIYSGLLTGRRTVIFTKDNSRIHLMPDDESSTVALANSMVIATVKSCESEWCLIDLRDYHGWVRKDLIWGVYGTEQF